MDVIFAVSTADSRELEFVHGMASIGLMELPPELRISIGVVAQTGFSTPAPTDAGPTEVGPI